MHEPDGALRVARERRPSPRIPGAHLTRAELAEAVYARLWESTGTRPAADLRGFCPGYAGTHAVLRGSEAGR